MNRYAAPCLAVLALLAAMPSLNAAETTNDFGEFEARIEALQNTINTDTASGVLKPEAIAALNGKQQELVNREAKLKAVGKMTPDEKSSFILSLKEQQKRIDLFTRAGKPAPKAVDPAAVPPSTYIAPNGTAIIAPGGSYNSGGATLPPNGPAIGPSPAPVVPVQ